MEVLNKPSNRMPGKVKNQGLLEQRRSRMSQSVKDIISYAENYGLVSCERETCVRKEDIGSVIKRFLENFGVTSCNIGTEFWKNTN